MKKALTLVPLFAIAFLTIGCGGPSSAENTYTVPAPKQKLPDAIQNNPKIPDEAKRAIPGG
jgi:hypothetical protein